MQKRNIHLKNIIRKRIPENRNLDKGLRLDRNERVSGWDKKIINSLSN